MNVAHAALYPRVSRIVMAIALGLAAGATGCLPTQHPVETSTLGRAASSHDLEEVVDRAGPITVETVVAADWQVPLSGLLNLEHPAARKAGLVDRAEPIQVFFHAVRHPSRGLFIVDSGIEKALRDDPDRAALRGLVASFMHRELMVFHNTTGEWLARQDQPLAGVFLTHLHLDHVSGLPDVPRDTPIYAGRGENTERSLQNLVVAPVIDRELDGFGPLHEWNYEKNATGSFVGAIDVFGDQSFWALHVPGHTAGMTAYLARTPSGPVLMVGDACHTAWGWEHQVEPGDYSSDKPTSVDSLARLKQFVKRHPSIDVRLGHQLLGKPSGPVQASGQAAR